MKIKHLLEYVFPKIQNVEVKTDRHPGQRNTMKPNDVKYAGGGNFSNVWQNPQKTPHDVRKISKGHMRMDIDGFYFYLLELEEHNDNTNPYFPRFREIKVYTDTHNDELFGNDVRRDVITYSTQIERLADMRKLNKSEEIAILFRIFGDRQHRKPAVDRFIEGILNNNQPYGQKLLGIIRVAITDNKFLRMLDDTDFKNAITFLKHVHAVRSVSYDLHDENIMVRRTPYGAQLVFVDPFSWQK